MPGHRRIALRGPLLLALVPRLLLLLLIVGAGPARADVGPDDPWVLANGQRIPAEPFPPFDPAGPRPPPPVMPANPTIRVLLAAFRDGERCAKAIQSAFDNAVHPDRISFGIAAQDAPSDPDCLELYCRGQPDGCPRRNQIHMKRMPASEATGPTSSRSQHVHLLGDSDFCLSADSHSILGPRWDEGLLHQWLLAADEGACLSSYPNGLETLTIKYVPGKSEVPHLCHSSIEPGPNIRNERASAAGNLKRPLLGFLWGAGLSFAKCHFERTVPVDPYLFGVFTGEEMSRAIRGFTHGYSFYTPMWPVLFHNYSHPRNEKNGLWRQSLHTPEAQRKQQLALGRLKKIYGFDPPAGSWEEAEFDRFGLGNKRTLQQYWEYSGIDIAARKGASSCEGRRWVPFDYTTQAPPTTTPPPPPPSPTPPPPARQLERAANNADPPRRPNFVPPEPRPPPAPSSGRLAALVDLAKAHPWWGVVVLVLAVLVVQRIRSNRRRSRQSRALRRQLGLPF